MKLRRCLLLALLSLSKPVLALDSPVNNVGASTDKVIPPTSDSPNNLGPTSPDRVLPGEPPKRKNYWIPALEIPSFLFVLNQADQRIYPNTVYNITTENFKDHLLHGHWHYDDDPFTINQAGHPYQGATMYGFARSAGLNFWESLGYANAGSLLWKIGGETDDPSINDQITTGQAGSILGEELYRMASLVLEQGGEHPEAWREWTAVVISPPTGLNRLIFGERFQPVESRNPATFTRLELGASNTAIATDNQGLGRQINQNEATGDFSMAYGLPGQPGYHYIRPFDYFDFEFEGTAGNSNNFTTLLTRGLLFGRPYEAGDDYRGVWGLYGSYDYMSPQIFRVSSTAASLGTTAQWWLSKHVALQGTGMAGLGFGAAGITTGVGDRNYHYGATPQTLLALRFIFGTRVMLDMTAREYYVSNVGATENAAENIARGDAALWWRVYRRHALGVTWVYTQRDAKYKNQPNRHQSVGTVGLAYNYLFDPHFGAVHWGGHMPEDKNL